MDNLNFRNLYADEISVRVSQINEKGCSLLLYKDARCDMNILDETVGTNNWQKKFYECKGNLFCSVGIKIQDAWIWKDDAGAETFSEKEKGEASDAFKRACFNWGIGRELYTAPFIWVPANFLKALSYKVENGKKKFFVHDQFFVSKIAYDQRKISGLAIWREKAKEFPSERVFVWSEKN